MSTVPKTFLRLRYAESAQEYLRSLPLEHFMEAPKQATQRKVTVESLDLVHADDPAFQVFNEWLVQYPGPGGEIRKVVPDNMVIHDEEPVELDDSFNLPLQKARPFWVLEYVSKSNKRKDYEDNFLRYERELKVPYYLIFYPDNQELTLFHRRRGKYVSVKPNENDRYPLPELNLEVALLDGWVRYWYKGKLLPLPAELQRELDETRRRLAAETRRADEQTRRADEEARRANEEAQRAEQERQARLAAERELAQLRAQLRKRPTNRK
jgi:Uma2 family endonuclease